ncbi:hypothetical protein OAG63_01685 [Methylacidiphilales bacterium]|nr:hypothetical protein [Candidatus Methylacidiphilales bacterium]
MLIKQCSKLFWLISLRCILILLICSNVHAVEIKLVSLPETAGLTRTDIYYIKPDYEPVACLVMCPGINGNGQYYLTNSALQAFASHYKVALIGLSFASDQDVINENKGYYTASQGAGQLLLDGIDHYVAHDVPVLLYGFSGGAHFVSSFEEAYPQRVLAWCAYTAAWWQDPQAAQYNPPGIVACGKLDQRFAQTFEYFQKGRKLGKPWCWIALEGTNHEENDSLNQFVQAYFGGILAKISDTGGWFDIKTKQKLDGDAIQQSEMAAWLPDNRVGELWSNLHRP